MLLSQIRVKVPQSGFSLFDPAAMQPAVASGRLGYVIPACGSPAGRKALRPADAVRLKLWSCAALVCQSASLMRRIWFSGCHSSPAPIFWSSGILDLVILNPPERKGLNQQDDAGDADRNQRNSTAAPWWLKLPSSQDLKLLPEEKKAQQRQLERN